MAAAVDRITRRVNSVVQTQSDAFVALIKYNTPPVDAVEVAHPRLLFKFLVRTALLVLLRN